jgi:NTE family protein
MVSYDLIWTQGRAMSKKELKIGLALSGGVGHCIAHVGVLKVLERSGIRVHSLAGTSGGALVASLFCSGRTVTELAEASHRIGWKRFAGLTLHASKGLATSEPIARFVARMIAPRTRFSEMLRPLAVTGTDLLSGETILFKDDSCPVSRAVRISCTIPMVYTPVEYQGRLLVDGGLSDPLPVDAARRMSPDVVIAVTLKSRPRDLRNLLEVGFRMLDVATATLVRLAKERADFTIEVDVGDTDKWDLSHAEGLIARGEAACERALPELLSLLRYRRSLEYKLFGSPLRKPSGPRSK